MALIKDVCKLPPPPYYKQALKSPEWFVVLTIIHTTIRSGLMATVRQSTLMELQQRCENGSNGRWTYIPIPHVEQCLEGRQGEVNFSLIQFFADRGNFSNYLCRFNLRARNACDMRQGVNDDAQHTAFVSPEKQAVQISGIRNYVRLPASVHVHVSRKMTEMCSFCARYVSI